MVAAINRTSNAMAAPSESAADEDEADISTLIARLTAEVDQIACEKAKSIQQITNQMKMLALNALIESSRAGALDAGFGVVAQEVRSVGQKVETISRELETQLTKRTANLMQPIQQMTERSRGERMPLTVNGSESGVYKDGAGPQVAFHLTPGYETYKGLGWFGVIVR